ncbi:MAG: hypothetical protein NC489_08085 [Ruminococcus flavefaciens]|nr:hypothetical protein [Ruminococcus flavefaciens]
MEELKVTEMFQIKAPPEIDERFSSSNYTQEDLERMYPGKLPYSYRTIACHVWIFLRKVLSLKCLPPPLIIDFREDLPSTRHYDTDGSLVTWINGMFNHSSLSLTVGSKELCVPMDYEVRLYHHNILEEISSHWGKHPIELCVLLTLTHTLMHEYCHFISLYLMYKKTVHGGNAATKKLLEYIRASNTVMDEYANEELTIRLMTQYWLTDPYHLNDLGNVVLGGPYDLWKRTTDPVWELTAMYLHKMHLANQIDGGVVPDKNEEYLRQIRDINRQVLKFLDENREYEVNFVLID